MYVFVLCYYNYVKFSNSFVKPYNQQHSMMCIIMPSHKTISIKSESFWEECMKLARREGNSLSGIIDEKLHEWFKIHGEGNPVYVLDKWVEDPEFKAIPAALEKQEKWVKFCQHCPIETLKEIEYAGMMMGIIARAYMRVPKEEKETKVFTNLHEMDVYWRE